MHFAQPCDNIVLPGTDLSHVLGGKRVKTVVRATSLRGLTLCALLAALATWSIAQAPRAAREGIKVVIAEGVGAYESPADKAKARDDAITDACRRAVEQAVGLFVKSESLLQNLTLVEDNVYTNARGYIQSYEVIDERVAGDLYRVRIRAQVSLDKIDSALDSLWEQFKVAGDPRFILLIEESPPDDMEPVVQPVLTERLVNLGVKVIDAQQLQSAQAVRLAKLVLDGDVMAAKTLGLQQKAEVIIVGRATWKTRGEVFEGSGLHSCEATLNARAIRVDTAQVIAARRAQPARLATGFTREDAVVKALTAAANEWLDACLPRLVEAAVDPTQVYQVTISNVRDFSEVDRIDAAIRNLRFTRNTIVRDYTPPLVQIDVYTLGTVRQLASNLAQVKEVRLDVRGVTASTITCAVRR